MDHLENLIRLYVPLTLWVGLGLLLGYKLPKAVPVYLGKGLFWVGVPLSIITFLRETNLSASIWVVPIVCWGAVLMGAGLSGLWIRGHRSLNPWLNGFSRQRITALFRSHHLHEKPTQGSFFLASMFGNTGYLGYPVVLSLVGPEYFGWAVFYDTLGSTLAAYGLGVMMASHFGNSQQHWSKLLQAVIQNPALWSFGLGLAFRRVPLPIALEQGLRGAAWTVIALSLLLIGMRLSQLTSWDNVQQASVSLGIKMLIVPLLIGVGLPWIGITGVPQLVIVLQMAMPPAFATLVIAEAYNLDRELTVTTLALGSIALLLLLPLWLWLFAP